jgi:glyoxylase-like metal-dependent hydrolase (beta-lactamase superfamily II)
MQRITMGDFELTAVSDGIYHSDGGAFFGVVPKSLWKPRVEVDENNLIPVGLNSIVVRTGRETILIETGIGNKGSERMVKIYGQPAKLVANLSAAGFAPEDFDIVIDSHLHFDHCGWNTVRKGDGVVEGEWKHAHENQRDGVSYFSENYDPLVESGQMTLLKGDCEIVPGISVRVYPGHTREMQAILIESGGKTACYISDLIPTSAHLEVNWVMAFDLYPLETIESRKGYYAESIPGKWLTMFTHDPRIPWAYVEKDAMGRMVGKSP